MQFTVIQDKNVQILLLFLKRFDVLAEMNKLALKNCATVCFNDLHKIWMQHGKNGKNFNNFCYIYRSACNFFMLCRPRCSLFFSHFLSPLSSNCPVRTDISIAQKTCVFSRLIYQISHKSQQINISVCIQPVWNIPSVCSLCSQPPFPRGRLLAVAGMFLLRLIL